MTGSLRAQQSAFAAHLRAPERHPPPPGVEARRIAIYRELVFNNLAALLAGNFPVIRKTLEEASWHALVRAFLADYRCGTPLFTEVGREFVRFLQERGDPADETAAGDLPWLAELAHYEWAELALQIADDALPAHAPQGDLLAGIPVISPFAWALAYRWPVHAIGPGQQPETPGDAPTLLLVRRDAQGDVRFSQLSPLVYRLLESLGDATPRTGRDTLRLLAGEAQATDLEAFLQQGHAMLQRLRAEGTLLGTVPDARPL